MSKYFHEGNATTAEFRGELSTFIKKLQTTIEKYAPQTDAKQTSLFQEQESVPYIKAIIRKNNLANISLVITYTPTRLSVSWAQINRLEYHVVFDDIGEIDETNFCEIEYDDLNKRDNAAFEHIKRQLERTIFFLVTYVKNEPIKITCSLKVSNKQYFKFETIYRTKRWLQHIFNRKISKLVETSFLENKSLDELLAQ